MNVLGVFAHPDDEVLGAGGTLAKHAEAGDDTNLLILGRPELANEADRARKTLGVGHWWLRTLPDQEFETVPFKEVVQRVVDHQMSSPDVIYTHHPGDLNLDHAITARAVLTAFRPKPGLKHRTILACEVLSSTEYTFPQAFSPNWFEEITDNQLNRKQRALACYPSELQEWPHPRNGWGIENLARTRGQQIGVRYAEAFQLLRRSC